MTYQDLALRWTPLHRVLHWSVCAIVLAGLATPALAQEPEEGEQSRESAALDNTAAQWSFQFAYQGMTDYRQDTLANGDVRPEGNMGYVQFRMVAPIGLGRLKILPQQGRRVGSQSDRSLRANRSV